MQGRCGAGKCGAVWCRARVVQGMVQNKVQGMVCRASVVQGGLGFAGRCGADKINVVHANVVQPYLDGGWRMRVWFHVVQYQGPH